MSNKVEEYVQLANETVSGLTSNIEEWKSFLQTASRVYKYRYPDQLMIHAQRPDATACASFELWNEKMGRYIQKGSKGIALLRNTGNGLFLSYVFDISNTGTRKFSKTPWLWEFKKEHTESVSQMFAKTYGIEEKFFPEEIVDVAELAAEEYWEDYKDDIIDKIDSSLLNGYDELNREIRFKEALKNSTAYSIMSRCGIDTSEYFDNSDFETIFDFTTNDSLLALGSAVNSTNKQILQEISQIIFNYERGMSHEQQSDLQQNRGLLPTESDDRGRTAEEITGQVRKNEGEISEGTSPDNLRSADALSGTLQSSLSDGGRSEETVKPDDYTVSESSRSNGRIEDDRSDEVGGPDEQLQGTGRGNSDERDNLQLSFGFVPTEQEQINKIDKAEEMQLSFALSFTQQQIDDVLVNGGNTDKLHEVVVAEFSKNKGPEHNAEFLKTVYHGGNGFQTAEGKISVWYGDDGIKISNGTSAKHNLVGQTITWEQAAERIEKLLDEGRYATNVEIAESNGYERYNIAEKLIYIHSDISDEYKSEYLPILHEEKLKGHPELKAELESNLADPEFRNRLITEYRKFAEDYKENPDIMRFRFYKINELLYSLEDLNLERKEYQSEMAEIPSIREFITRDEINADLTGGTGFSEGKNRVYNFFAEEEHTLSEKITFLKNEYGTGGHSAALSQHFHSWQNHDAKGIEYQKPGCDNVLLKWSEVAERLDELISKDRYLTEKDKKAIQEKTVQFIEKAETDTRAELREYAEKNLIPNETEFLWDDRKFRVDSINYTSMEVSLQDITMLENVGFPIFRLEKIASVRKHLETLPVEREKNDEQVVAENIGENFKITDMDLGVGTPKEKYKANIDAIKLVKKLDSENRQATAEEQLVLSKYVGWGGLSDAFSDKANWANEFKELQELLTPAEYESARASTLNAHYTSPTVINAIYETLDKMGYESGNILEPACGTGNFLGMLPDKMGNSKLYGVELDTISGKIAKQLYPQANIQISGFEEFSHKDFFDVAIGNVPFGNYGVNDKEYDKLKFSIHNYFFAKSLDQVRPGGVVAFVTSRYTMDSKDEKVRSYLAQRAELLGAIRLPNNAFKANAGTEVVSDIIFLQKRDRPIDIKPSWVELSPNEQGYMINSYFDEHPEMVLGKQTDKSTAHGMDYTVEPLEDISLSELLHNAVNNINAEYKEIELTWDDEEEQTNITSIPADPNVKNYSFTVIDGEIYYRENSIMTKDENLSVTAQNRIKGLYELNQCTQKLINAQLDADTKDEQIKEIQGELNTRYDEFTAKYGLINDRANAKVYDKDSSYYLLCSLEEVDENGKLVRKADMFSKRTIKPHKEITSVETANEALTVSIAEKANVDIDYMQKLTGMPEDKIIEDLQGAIYPLPNSQNENGRYKYVTADEYLSGNVRMKLREAERVAENNPEFNSNVSALKAAQPKDLDASEIEVRLGATWIDKHYIEEFMHEVFSTPRFLYGSVNVNYSPATAEWRVTNKTHISHNDVNANTTYGTSRANAYRILEDTLNLRDVRIYDKYTDEDGKERRVLNSKETTLAAQKQQAIKDAFRDWIWRDPERRETLVKQYNEEMNSTRPREYDGSYIDFGGINPEIQLREHQKNAIAHVLYGGNTLLAHEVGAGKTFEMVAAAMESKRLGLCQKSMFAVPNHLTEQWASEFLKLYPAANILVATKKDFEPANRKKFCARIATGEYDAVIIGHSQFEKIPISKERQERLINEQIDEITNGIEEMKYLGSNERFTVKQLEKTKKSLQTKLEKLKADDRKDDVVTFEQLGVDRLFVDESHNYKNLFLYTKMRNVAGLSTSDAQKSSDMFAKCRYMDEITGNRGIVFATGTPISNSITELYTIQRYLQYDKLQELNMSHFDCWASRFGETTTALELAPEGTGYRARTRFSKFFNLPELMAMFKEVADIKTADQLNLPTPEVEYHNVVAKPTESQKEMVQALSERAVKIHNGSVDPSVDNMLKITSDGRKLGLDQRIINPLLPDEEGTKVNQCIDNVMDVWEKTKAEKSAQLVFCDISTPSTKAKNGEEKDFTVYDNIRKKLIEKGVPEKEIAFIHDANTDIRKKELFKKVREGDVRVLLGSTAKMGAGTNVQERLVAMHDLDCPWRPGDLEQRKGRIERQGNKNKKVHVFRYVTEGTFDAYLWQTVENKQKFISQIMTSKSPVRSCEDIDETALSFAEVKALCAGDPRIKERMDLDVDVSRLKLMKADYKSKKYKMEDQLLKYFPQEIAAKTALIKGFENDLQILSSNPLPKDSEEFIGIEIMGTTYTDKAKAGEALLDACRLSVKHENENTIIGNYRGFGMNVTYDSFNHEFRLHLKDKASHTVTLGNDARGNILRIDNMLEKMPDKLEEIKAGLEDLHNQKKAAQDELDKPFPQEDELKTKSARLTELDTILNIGDNAVEETVEKNEKIPLYLETYMVSADKGEVDLYHKSKELNQNCCEDIGKIISESYNYESYSFSSESAVDKALENYSPDRIAYIVASAITSREGDGRISERVHEWAREKMDELPDHLRNSGRYYTLNSNHSGLVNMFAEKFIDKETELTKKPSLLEKLKKPVPAIKTEHKEKSNERDDR